ncbi:MAG: hypothetical protein U0840_00210 [Gemmataceae bacterium]
MSGNAQQATTSPTQAARLDVMQIGRRVLGTALQFWWIGLTYLALLAGVSGYVAWKYTRYTWEARASLLYSSLPVPDQQRDLYSPPDLKTLTGLVTTPRVLDQACAEKGLEGAARALERNLEVTNTPGTRVLLLRLRWEDGKTAQELLDRVSDLFREQVAELRRQKIEGHLEDYQKSRQECHARWLESLRALQQFSQGTGTTDLKTARTRQAEEVLSLESSLALARRNHANTQTQLKHLDEYIKQLKNDATQQAEKQREFEAAEETVADNRRRQDRLRELIADERKLEETRLQLDVRRREQERLRPLVAKGLKPRGEYDRLQAEIGALVARISENDKICEWKKELDRIDKVVVPKGKSQSQGSPIIQQTLFRRLELELQLKGIDEELRQVSLALDEKRKEIEKLGRAQQQAESLAREVEAADTHRQRIDSQIAALRQLQALGSAEFVVVTHANVGSFPLSSNRKVLLAGCLGAGVIFGLVFLAGFDFWRFSRSAEGVAGSLGLPVVAQVAPLEEGLDNAPGIRGLALTLRQHVDRAGAIVLFSPAGPAPHLEPMIHSLASCLARRDERVLILDGRLGEASDAGATGLRDYLSFSVSDVDEVIRPALLPGVDFLSAGKCVNCSEALATHRMRELIEQLRTRYSMILLHGPSLKDSVDLTILAAFTEGMIIVAERPPLSLPVARKTLSSLVSLEAPIIGQVVLTDRVGS